MENYKISVSIGKIKSFFEENNLLINKPINVIVGGNNSGKSNLLNSFYYLFHENDTISEVQKNLQKKENITYSILYDKGRLSIPSFNASDYLKIKEKEGMIAVGIAPFTTKDGSKTVNSAEFDNFLYGEILISQGKPNLKMQINPDVDFFDCMILTSNTQQQFGTLLSEKIAKLTLDIPGGKAKGAFNTELTDIISNNIEGVNDFNFEKQQVEDNFSGAFIGMSCVSAGFQKSLFLQYLCYFDKLRKIKKFKKFLSIILIDEIENGLHPPLQKDIPYQIVNLIKDKKLHQNVRIILTTHSPIIYSSFLKLSRENSDLIDTFYIYRNNHGGSTIIKKEDMLLDDGKKGLMKLAYDEVDINKAIEVELGLSIYDLPRIATFVEGNDEHFLRGVLDSEKLLEEIKIFPAGGSLPSRMWDIIDNNLLSYTRKVIFFFDEDKKTETKNNIKNLKNNINIPKDFYFGPEELEFFIYGEAKDSEEQNKNIKNVITKLSAECSKDEKKITDAFLRDLGNKNYEQIKGAKTLHNILGKHYKSILEEKQINYLDKFLKEIRQNN